MGAGKGKFKDSSFTTLGGTKAWEWELAPAFPGVSVVSEKAPGSGNAKLQVAGLGDVECEMVSDAGKSLEHSWSRRGFRCDVLTKGKATGGVAGCAVAEPIVVEAETSLEEAGGNVFNQYTPLAGKPFTVVEFLPAPPCPGALEVTGLLGRKSKAAISCSIAGLVANCSSVERRRNSKPKPRRQGPQAKRSGPVEQAHITRSTATRPRRAEVR